MSLSVVVPTVGRPTLWAALASVVDQLEDDDKIVVVADTAEPEAMSRVAVIADDFLPASIIYLGKKDTLSSFGNAQRDVGMAFASATHLLFLDDDDVYEHGALEHVRREISRGSANSAHVFCARWGPGHHAHGAHLWETEEVRPMNIATPMVCLPNRSYQRSWMDGNDQHMLSDYAFLEAAIGECDGIRWHTDVVATIRP